MNKAKVVVGSLLGISLTAFGGLTGIFIKDNSKIVSNWASGVHNVTNDEYKKLETNSNEKITELTNQKSVLEESIVQKTLEIESLRSEMDLLDESHAQERAELEAQISQLESDVEANESAISDLESRLATIDEEHQSEKNELQGQISILESDIEQLNQTNTELTEQLLSYMVQSRPVELPESFDVNSYTTKQVDNIAFLLSNTNRKFYALNESGEVKHLFDNITNINSVSIYSLSEGYLLSVPRVGIYRLDNDLTLTLLSSNKGSLIKADDEHGFYLLNRAEVHYYNIDTNEFSTLYNDETVTSVSASVVKSLDGAIMIFDRQTYSAYCFDKATGNMTMVAENFYDVSYANSSLSAFEYDGEVYITNYTREESYRGIYKLNKETNSLECVYAITDEITVTPPYLSGFSVSDLAFITIEKQLYSFDGTNLTPLYTGTSYLAQQKPTLIHETDEKVYFSFNNQIFIYNRTTDTYTNQTGSATTIYQVDETRFILNTSGSIKLLDISTDIITEMYTQNSNPTNGQNTRFYEFGDYIYMLPKEDASTSSTLYIFKYHKTSNTINTLTSGVTNKVQIYKETEDSFMLIDDSRIIVVNIDGTITNSYTIDTNLSNIEANEIYSNVLEFETYYIADKIIINDDLAISSELVIIEK